MKKTAVVIILISLFLLTFSYLSPTQAQTTWTCGSCYDCSEYLQNSTLSVGDTLTLTADIINHDGTCISFGGKDNVTFDCDGFTVSGNGSTSTGYGIWLNDSDGGSDNNIVMDCTNVSYFNYGLYLYSSHNNTLTNITASGNYLSGLRLSYSNNNTITSITANSNTLHGLHIHSSHNNTLTSITVSGSQYEGLSLTTITNNTITNITVSGNFRGIKLYGHSQYNTINDSRIENNTDYGIFLDASGPARPTYNTLYNNYLNNSLNFLSDDDLNQNYWNTTLDCSSGLNIIGGPCIGGNYWTDPDGYNFSNECTDSDKNGICDSPYILDTGNQDELPIAFYYEPPDTTLPVIDSYEILPTLIPFGEKVSIGANASDDEAIDEVWANITEPTDPPTYHIIGLFNDNIVEWQTGVIGAYAITIFANDTSSNTVNVTDSFYVNNVVDVNITVLDIDDEGISTDLEIYIAGTDQRVFWDHESDGEFDVSLVEHDYDMLFQVFDDQFKLLFRRVPLVSGFDGNLSLDYTSLDDFDQVFAVETDYGMDDAVVTIYYEDMGFDNETNAHAYLCDDWDFSTQVCNDTWEMIDNFTNDEDDEFLEFTVDGFSAFAVREDTYCGDGWCGPGETVSSCPDDCQCDEGDTRPCGDAHQGICAVGNETCHSNVWFGCPQPTNEACNREDDDCNGKIDDVDGGASVAATRCQCYDDGTPQAETCNGIDDNCDGFIDNGADCCTDGQERDCGPVTELGECKFGTSTCSGGGWGACIGAVLPIQEICGDGLDNDCDGETDENCDIPQCSEGQINQSCLCEGSARDSGYCCSGLYSEEECVETLWWILIVIGVAVLVVLIALILYFKSRGREFTWEELSKRYTGPPPQRPASF